MAMMINIISNGRRREVRGQESEVRSQRSEVGDPGLA